MSIERFSKEQFEQALFNIFPGVEELGLDTGEYCYSIPVNSHTRLKIRSSVDRSGFAADTGQDSIRLWLEVSYDGKWRATSRKVDAYTTRIPGWEKRLEDKIRTLWDRAVKIKQAPISNCPNCNRSIWVNFVKKQGKNTGRPFQSCFRRDCNGGHYEWLDIEPVGKVDFEIEPEEIKEIEPMFDFLNETVEDLDKPDFEPSEYQKAIFNWVENGNGHGICEAVAGSGKTTTNIEALKYVPANMKSVFLAFNRHIARELKERGVDNASTMHSLGKSAIDAAIPQAKFQQYKNYNACDKITGNENKLSYDDKGIINKIIGLLKGNLLDCNRQNIRDLIDNFPSIGRIEEEDIDFYVDMVMKVWDLTINDETQYDFDDMIYWPATGKVSCQKFDFIFVDECQDLNKAQINFAENSLTESGRMLLIGDPHQSIYAFRGAFVGIMEYMNAKLQATQLPLTISYRAPLQVVDYVNRSFPHIQFEPAPNARQGKIDNVDMDYFLDTVKAGDGIICRTNAPLVPPCFALLRQGIKATILGRDIGKGLISLVNKRAKLDRTNWVDYRKKTQEYSPEEKLINLLQELRIYFSNEKAKLEKLEKFSTIQTLEDQIETIIAISDDCQTIDELKQKIKNTFSDDAEGIVFSSIHKAKGLEWDRVYILRPDLLPHPMAKRPEDKAQEQNLRYVATTRTKNELYFVSGK